MAEAGKIKDANYIDPVEDPYNKAISYLEKHNILQLFQVSNCIICLIGKSSPIDNYIVKHYVIK